MMRSLRNMFLVCGVVMLAGVAYAAESPSATLRVKVDQILDVLKEPG